MRKGKAYRSFAYSLCVTLLLLMNGFPRMIAEAKERSLPIGEMVSRGDVKFEARENLWKNVESSQFPIFQGVKIKTEKGVAVITLASNSQIEVGQDSFFFFDPTNRLNLFQGRIDFRIPAASETDLKIRNLTIIKSRTMQAGKAPAGAAPKSEEIIGAVSIHPNGSVTLKSFQGSFSVLGKDRAFLAALSSQETVTIPSVTASGDGKWMVAQPLQDDDSKKKKKEGAGFAEGGGMSTLGAIMTGAGAVGTATGLAVGSSTSGPQSGCQ